MLNTVVWDLDGTLVDSAADIALSVNLVLAGEGLSSLPVDDIRLMIGNGAGKLLERAFAVADNSHSYSADHVYKRFLVHYQNNSCVETAFYPGIKEIVQRFHQLGVVQGVCTNKPYTITTSILEQLSVDSYFGAVIGGDSTAKRKPHALPLQTCIDELRSDYAAVLMVGDSPADIGAAKACGVQSAAVSWGYSREPVSALGADFVITSSDELLSLPISGLQ